MTVLKSTAPPGSLSLVQPIIGAVFKLKGDLTSKPLKPQELISCFYFKGIYEYNEENKNSLQKVENHNLNWRNPKLLIENLANLKENLDLMLLHGFFELFDLNKILHDKIDLPTKKIVYKSISLTSYEIDIFLTKSSL